MTIYTIGHSTLAADEFAGLLQLHGIQWLADVRRFAFSRKWPHFNGTELAGSLAGKGIGYTHFESLGGRRAPSKTSRNINWRNASFRGYADYMETAAFQTAVDDLLKQSHDKTTALMCSEALWWRCHRSLIADFLKSLGHEVLHIFPDGKTKPHTYTAAAQIAGGKLNYGNPIV